MTLQSVILDIDVTLILSNDAHACAWVEAFEKEIWPRNRVRGS